jgi:hypothetical protein
MGTERKTVTSLNHSGRCFADETAVRQGGRACTYSLSGPWQLLQAQVYRQFLDACWQQCPQHNSPRSTNKAQKYFVNLELPNRMNRTPKQRLRSQDSRNRTKPRDRGKTSKQGSMEKSIAESGVGDMGGESKLPRGTRH